MNYIFTVALIFLSTAALADGKIYKTTDANGNPVFTDSAPESAPTVDVPGTQTYPAKRYAEDYSKFKPASPASKAASGPPYRVLRVVSPKPGESVRSNPGEVTISLELDPPLKPHHRLELIMDGKSVAQLASASMPVDLKNVDRGTHNLQIRVTSMETGNMVQESAVSSFTLHRHSILQPKPKHHMN